MGVVSLNQESEDYTANTLNGLDNMIHNHTTRSGENWKIGRNLNSSTNELKLKRPHVSEEQSINSIPAAKTVTLVPEDDDYHYLLSLHPYMKQLTAAQKLRTRTKIQRLIFKELFKEDIEDTK